MQNLAPAGFAAPQLGQVVGSEPPHDMQKRAVRARALLHVVWRLAADNVRHLRSREPGRSQVLHRVAVRWGRGGEPRAGRRRGAATGGAPQGDGDLRRPLRYTAVAERLHPERYKSLVDRALRRLGEEVDVDEFIGDDVIGVFGAPSP